MEISGIAGEIISGLKAIDGKNTADKDGFGQMLNQMIDQIEQNQQQADVLTQKLMTGSVEDLHQVTFAMDQAKLSLQLAVQVRNKLVEAYQEVMRMQV